MNSLKWSLIVNHNELLNNNNAQLICGTLLFWLFQFVWIRKCLDSGRKATELLQPLSMQVQLAPQGEGLQSAAVLTLTWRNQIWSFDRQPYATLIFLSKKRDSQLCWVQRLSRSQQERQKERAAWLLFAFFAFMLKFQKSYQCSNAILLTG